MLRESFGEVVRYADVESSRSVREDVDGERAHEKSWRCSTEQPSSLSPAEERIVAGAREVQIPRLAALARDDRIRTAQRCHPERSRGSCTSYGDVRVRTKFRSNAMVAPSTV